MRVTPGRGLHSAYWSLRMPLWLSAIALALAGICVAWPAPFGSEAGAQSAPEFAQALSVRGETPGCLTARMLRERIAHYLPAGIRPVALAVEVDLQRKPPSFQLRNAGEVVAERRFARLPADCAGRRNAIALTIAVAIEHALPATQPDAGAEPPLSAATSETEATATRSAGTTQPQTSAELEGEVRPASAAGSQASAAGARSAARRTAVAPVRAAVEPEPQPAPSEPPSEEEVDSGETVGARPWVRPSEKVMVYAGAALLFEAVPRSGGVPALVLGGEYAVLPALRVSLGGLVSAERQSSFEGGGVESQLFGGQAAACGNVPFHSLIVLGCTGLSVAYVRAEGLGYGERLTDAMVWFAGRLRGALEFPSSGAVALRLGADGHVNFIRPEVRVQREGRTYNSRDIGVFGGSFGAEMILRID